MVTHNWKIIEQSRGFGIIEVSVCQNCDAVRISHRLEPTKGFKPYFPTTYIKGKERLTIRPDCI